MLVVIVHGDIAYIDSAQSYAAAVNVPEACYEPCHCGFTAARGSHQGNELSVVYRH